MSKLIKTHILNRCSLMYFNYTPNKVMTFFKEKNMLLNTRTLGLALSHRWESFCHPLDWPQGGEWGQCLASPPTTQPQGASPTLQTHTMLTTHAWCIRPLSSELVCSTTKAN